MNKPYVILMMMTSIDGKIDGSFIHDHNEELGNFFEEMKLKNSDAWGNGSNTHEIYFGDGNIDLSFYIDKPISYEDNVIKGTNPYIVSFDTKGKVKWTEKSVDIPEGIKNDVLVVTTKAVRPEYIAYLDKMNISYIFAGETEIDLSQALDKLYRKFDIKKFAIVGGATINAKFIEQDLVDEIRVVIAPFIDGSQNKTIVETTDNTSLTKEFFLKEISKLENDGVMTVYQKNRS